MFTTIIVEYTSVFEANQALRLIEKAIGKKIVRDHNMGSLKFEIPLEYYEYLKDKVDLIIIEPDSEHARNISRIVFRES